MKKFIAPWFVLVCGLVFLSGCGNSSKIIAVGLRPEITLIEQKSGGVPSVSWQIVNTNIVPYLLSKVENKIYLNGKLVGTCSSTTPIAIPAQTSAGATDILQLESGGDAVLRAAAGSSASYRVETTIIIQIYGDTTEKSRLENIGSVKVSG
jgi:hypothetical protein